MNPSFTSEKGYAPETSQMESCQQAQHPTVLAPDFSNLQGDQSPAHPVGSKIPKSAASFWSLQGDELVMAGFLVQKTWQIFPIEPS